VYALAMTACTSRAPVHTAPDESRPHISWEIQEGAGADEDFVCGSRKPGVPCVLSARSEEQRTRAIVQVQLHAAKADTKYLGVIEVPFVLGGTGRQLTEVSADVAAGGTPANRTIVGQVVAERGEYALSITLDAVQGGRAVSRLSERIPVSVR
jgi:hypothetical protein